MLPLLEYGLHYYLVDFDLQYSHHWLFDVWGVSEIKTIFKSHWGRWWLQRSDYSLPAVRSTIPSAALFSGLFSSSFWHLLFIAPRFILCPWKTFTVRTGLQRLPCWNLEGLITRKMYLENCGPQSYVVLLGTGVNSVPVWLSSWLRWPQLWAAWMSEDQVWDSLHHMLRPLKKRERKSYWFWKKRIEII